MTDYSSSTSSSSIVRKFTDSVVIGSHKQQMRGEEQPTSKPAVHQQVVHDPRAQQHKSQQQQAQQQSSKKPRVVSVSCNFEMKIPTNALRIDMSIIVSTNDNFNNSSDRVRSDETMLPRPSVTYKITICTPRRQEEEETVATHRIIIYDHDKYIASLIQS